MQIHVIQLTSGLAGWLLNAIKLLKSIQNRQYKQKKKNKNRN